jgi:hypothetical protein
LIPDFSQDDLVRTKSDNFGHQTEKGEIEHPKLLRWLAKTAKFVTCVGIRVVSEHQSARLKLGYAAPQTGDGIVETL